MNFKVSIWWYVFFILSLVANNLKTWLILFAMLLIHEGGHILTAKYLGYHVSQLTIYPFGCGAEIEHIDHGSTTDEMLILLGGIGMHLFYPLCFTLFQHWGLISHAYQNYLTQLNASIMLFNLLPIYPLDGGRLLDCLLQAFLPYRLGRQLTLLVSLGALLCLLVMLHQPSAMFAIGFLFIQWLMSCFDVLKDYHDFMLYRYLYPKHLPIKIHSKDELYRNYSSIFQRGKHLIHEEEWLHHMFNQN